MVDHINVLHLSDVHYTRDKSKQAPERVLQAAFRDLRENCSRTLRPDLIVITGDLVDVADEPDVYSYFYDEVIAELELATGCSEERIFVCPGNHDAHRSVVIREMELHRRIYGTATDDANLSLIAGESEVCDLVISKFKEFNVFRDCVGGKPAYSDEFLSVYHVEQLSLDIISVNSAWLTSTGMEGLRSDDRQLMVPERSLLAAQQQCKPDRFRICLTHHPLEWLAPHSRGRLESLMGDNSEGGRLSAHLYGHMHDVQPKQISSLTGRRLSAQSGALFAGKNRYNGYSLIRVSPATGHLEVRIRSHFDKRQMFDDGVDVVSGGTFYPDNISKNYWRSVDASVDREMLKDWAEKKYLPAMTCEYDQGITDRPIGDVFVAPPMHIKKEIEDVGSPEDADVEQSDHPITIDNIVNSSGSFILNGRSEYGKTTVLQQLSIDLLRAALNTPADLVIPFYVRFADIRPGRNPLPRAVRASLVEELESPSLKDIFREGLAVLLVDDVKFDDKTRMDCLSSFLASYSRNRFIFTTSSDEKDSVPGPLGTGVEARLDTPVKFENVYLRPLSRRALRSIVKKWDRDKALDQEQILNRLVREITSMHLPATAFISCILLTIYEDHAGFTPINRAVLVDRFVEHVLEKRSPAEALSSTFDFTNKVHVLSDLAEQMARTDAYVLSTTEVLTIMQRYLDRIGLVQDVDGLLSVFIGARILESRPDHGVSFRYRAFLEYFIASQMKIRAEFRDWILREERYLKFVNEIGYYAGINRTEASLLELIGRRFEQYWTEIEDHIGPDFNWEKGNFAVDQFIPLASDNDESGLRQLERTIDQPPLSEAERDDILDDELPTDGAINQEAIRPSPTGIEEKWTLALMLYATVLKNLEIVPDAVKRVHLKNVLEGWAQLTSLSLAIVPILARERAIRVNGVNYRVIAPRSYSDAKVARRIILSLPSALSRNLMLHLGTEKLEQQLKAPQVTDPKAGLSEEAKIVSFYRHCLIFDLRLKGWLDEMKKCFSQVASANYVRDAFLDKISDVYYLGAHTREVQATMKRLMIAFITAARTGKGADRQKIHNDVSRRVEHATQLRRLKVSLKGDDEPIES